MKNSKLQFIKYDVEQLYFENNSNFVNKSKNIDVNPKIGHKFDKINDNQFSVSLQVLINCGNKCPFTSHVEIKGTFIMENWESKENIGVAKENTLAILFPLLRSCLSSLIVQGGYPSFLLPIVDVKETE